MLLSFWAFAQVHSRVASASAIRSFETQPQTDTAGSGSSSTARSAGTSTPATTTTSVTFPTTATQTAEAAPPAGSPAIAVLRIERLRLVVPVFHGTGKADLNRGAGWIETTASPGSDGNVGIAGHRDQFFRPLKDIKLGDAIELDAPDGDRTYVVTGTSIVEPTRVDVLDPSPEPQLTLVTCYPFYYVGAAPKRFIVHASIKRETASQ